MRTRQASAPLPAYRHLPGVNTRPEGGIVEEMAALAPGVTDPAAAAANPAWGYGLRLLRHGYYWEAHEVLEPVWFNAAPNSRERFLVQAVIQLANALLKAELGRRNAALRLAVIAGDLFAEAAGEGGGAVMNADPGAGRDAAVRLAAALQAGRPAVPEVTPFIDAVSMQNNA